MAAVRERFGDDLLLQVDANAAYTLADAGHLAGLDGFGLLLIEQPLAEDDLLGHAELARRLATPICLDESITSARAAADAIGLGACRIVNVKAGRVGGYLEARRLHDVCAGPACPCGAAGCWRPASAGRPTSPWPRCPASPCPATPRPPTATTAGPDRPVRARRRPPRGPLRPGIGVEPVPEILEELTTSVEWVPA